MTMLHLSAPQPELATAAQAGRDTPSLSGVLIPAGTVGRTPQGAYLIAAEGLQLAGVVPLLREHDAAGVAAGVLTGGLQVDQAGNVRATFDLLDTTAGRDTVAELRAGYRVGLSVGVDVLQATAPDSRGVRTVTAGRLAEVSLVRAPAFAGAGVESLAAELEPEPQPDPELEPQPGLGLEPEPQPEPQPADPEPDPQPDPGPAPADPDQPDRKATPVDPITTEPRGPQVTAGEYLQAYAVRFSQPEAWERLTAAAPHTLTTDIPGLLPEYVVGQVFGASGGVSPVFDSFTQLSQTPSGSHPQIARFTTHLDDAAAAAEKADVTKQLVIGDAPFSWVALKRAFNLSAEAVYRSQPAVLDLALQDLARSIVRGRENQAVAALTATLAISGNTPVSATSYLAGIVSAIGALEPRLEDLGAEPDRLYLGADAWAAYQLELLASPQAIMGVDTAAPFGLRVVRSSKLDPAVAAVGASVGLLAISGSSARMQVEEPTILGVAGGAYQDVACGDALAAGSAVKITVTAATAAAAPVAAK